jgi:hypothetical protein
MELMNCDQLAAYLQISKQACRELSRQRTRLRSPHPIPLIKISKKCVRYPKDAVITWLQQIQASQTAGGVR